MTCSSVRVRPRPRGGWEVLLSTAGRGVPCDTLHEARRIAVDCAVRSPACEVIVFDAYNRVVEREVIGRPPESALR